MSEGVVMSEQPMTDEELWKTGERYQARLDLAEAVCEAFTQYRTHSMVPATTEEEAGCGPCGSYPSP